MFKAFYPNDYQPSAYRIDFSKYEKEGYRGIIFDIDNTLVMHGAPVADAAIELFELLRGLGYDTCLISNNNKERVKPFADAVSSKYICNAGKPSRKNYIKAMELMNTNKSNTMFVGDQIFTDIWGANRTGIYSILVKPISSKEEIQIVLKRIIEKPIIKSYLKKAGHNI
ncbi:MAG: YqeG family HAD IIIA-type phosphatase [Eubacterium sp.]